MSASPTSVLHRLAAWGALVAALALAIGGGTISQDLVTLFGVARAEQVMAAARVVAALVAAGTGAILVRRSGRVPE